MQFISNLTEVSLVVDIEGDKKLEDKILNIPYDVCVANFHAFLLQGQNADKAKDLMVKNIVGDISMEPDFSNAAKMTVEKLRKVQRKK